MNKQMRFNVIATSYGPRKILWTKKNTAEEFRKQLEASKLHQLNRNYSRNQYILLKDLIITSPDLMKIFGKKYTSKREGFEH